MSANEETATLLVVQKLLALAEAGADADLTDTRSKLKWRREVLEKLDILVEHAEASKSGREGREDAIVLTRAEAKSLLKTIAPYVVAVISGLSGWLWHLFHAVK
jgi:hypothetical protein